MTEDVSTPPSRDDSNSKLPAAETEYADTHEKAKSRSSKYRGKDRDVDPFPKIKPALLSSEHIKAYVRETGMIFPFEDSPSRLKSASYEVNPGGEFIYWDEKGKKIATKITKGCTLTLPRNSISFIQIDAEFRLPQYIAVRFNLRITHVHRGLLLGTGPLVDPGFHGNLLIPLHNLTSDEYTIRADEGLIWMEFTKTSHEADPRPVRDAPEDKLAKTEARKNDQPPEYYFDRAAKNRPIRSSIPIAITEARDLSQKAHEAAQKAMGTNRIFVGAGLLAIAGTVVGLFSFFESVKGNAIASYDLAATVAGTAAQAASEAKNARDEIKSFKTVVTEGDVQRSQEIQLLRAQLNEAGTELEALNARMRSLEDEIRSAR